jgi:hypothetical protein
VLRDQVQGWLLMRRAGLTEEQRTLVTEQLGKEFKFDKVASVRQTTLGQQRTMRDKRIRQAPAAVRYQDFEDYGDETYYEQEDYEEDGYVYEEDNDVY